MKFVFILLALCLCCQSTRAFFFGSNRPLNNRNGGSFRPNRFQSFGSNQRRFRTMPTFNEVVHQRPTPRRIRMTNDELFLRKYPTATSSFFRQPRNHRNGWEEQKEALEEDYDQIESPPSSKTRDRQSKNSQSNDERKLKMEVISDNRLDLTSPKSDQLNRDNRVVIVVLHLNHKDLKQGDELILNTSKDDKKGNQRSSEDKFSQIKQVKFDDDDDVGARNVNNGRGPFRDHGRKGDNFSMRDIQVRKN
ncbi:hypothetical protein HDE_08315 [Halotydeus destructor]|nr:hypothetical protein HDE_08315 [Halotydeus destructor]